MPLERPSIVRVTRVPDVLDSLTPVGTEVPAGLEAACALPGVRAFTSPTDPEVTLLVPADDEPDPEVTLLVPGGQRADHDRGVRRLVPRGPARRQACKGEILIVDAPTDETPELAVAGGARVLHTPLRGLGRAYIDSIPYVRGRLRDHGRRRLHLRLPQAGAVRRGDAQRHRVRHGLALEGHASSTAPCRPCTSTSARRSPPGSSTASTAATSATSTAACAASPATRCVRMGLVSQSWEYASEMVLKSVRMELRTTEVPVTFLKDQEGRLSHHKRSGWFSPFAAAWINLRAMFIHGAEFFLFKPGHHADRAGPAAFAAAVLRRHHDRRGHLQPADHAASASTLVGDRPAEHLLRLSGPRVPRLRRTACASAGDGSSRYTKMMVISGSALHRRPGARRRPRWSRSSAATTRSPTRRPAVPHLGVLGLMLMIVGFSTFCFTLLLHATSVRYGPAGSTVTDADGRSSSFGESGDVTIVDRFGVWLSKRQIERVVGPLSGKDVADIGCGYEADFMRTRPRRGAARATLVDVSLAADLADAPEGARHRGAAARRDGGRSRTPRSTSCSACRSSSTSGSPSRPSTHFHRVLRPGGVCAVNVPSWRGKRALEYSAFRLGTLPGRGDGRPQDVLRPEGPLAADGEGRLHAPRHQVLQAQVRPQHLRGRHRHRPTRTDSASPA